MTVQRGPAPPGFEVEWLRGSRATTHRITIDELRAFDEEHEDVLDD